MSNFPTRLFLVLFLCILSASLVRAQQFTAENIAQFRVDGVELMNPFAGGLNAPQFSNADLNDDGLMDVLIFDRIGSVIIPMIRQGEGFIFDPSFKENFPAIDNFLLMMDYNNDGIEDIFCFSVEPGIPGVSVFTGKYTDGKIDFDLVNPPDFSPAVLNFQLSNGSFSNIAVLNSDIPSFEDIDSDGDVDIVTFNFLGGYVEYYKNFTMERGGSLDDFEFIRVDDCYGGFFEAGLTEEVELPTDPDDCANRFAPEIVTPRHAGSTVLSLDHDGDGDFEILLGDLAFDNITLLENGGDSEEAFFNRQIVHYPDMANEPVDISIFPAAFYVDIDGDNVRDFVSAPNNINNAFDINNVWYYRNSGEDDNPIFELESKNLFGSEMVDLGSIASPTFADVNGDNLLDLVVGTETTFVEGGEKDARLYLFLNVGSSTEPIFELTDENWLDFQRFNSLAFDFIPTFADLDDDGDLDLYVGETNGSIFQVVNSAGPGQAMEFGQIIPSFQDIDIGKISAPTFYDADNDGLLDIVIGERNGNINFIKNTGSRTNPVYTADLASPNNTESYGQIDTRIPPFIVGYSKPTFIETEDNGQVLITGTGHGSLQMYGLSDDVRSEFPLLNDAVGNTRVGEQIAPAFVDIDSDGFYEAFIGNRRGGLSGFKTDMRVPISVSTSQAPERQEINLVSTLVRDIIQLKEPFLVKMSVYSTLGQELISASSTRELNVSNLPAGVYFVLLEGDGIQSTQKFVKM